MNRKGDAEELLDLLGALANGSITPEEHQRLGSILAEDRDARKTYFDYLDIHFGLHRWALRDRERQPLEELREQLSLWLEESGRGLRLPLRARYALVIAATLAVSLLLQLLLFPSHPQLGAAVPEQDEYVATLRRASDCVWNQPAAPREGARLLPGDVELASGVAEILFDSGAQLILAGPASLRIESASAATLLRGSAVVGSDETVEPFVLQTPASRLVNYQTEAATAVDASEEEVHVFDGVVRRQPKAARHSPTPTEQLTAGSARKYVYASGAARAVPLATTRFVRQMPHRLATRDPAASLLAYEGFEYPDGFLASGYSGSAGWAGPWAVPRESADMFNPNESLVRPEAESASLGGSIDFSGIGMIQRQLASAIRLDQDGVYYFSFLFRRSAGASKPPNTFLLTLSHAQYTLPQQRLVVGVAQPNHVVFANLEGGGVRTPMPLDYDKTYLLVGKLVSGQKTPDQVFLRIYRPDEPVERREPASWSVVSRPVRSDLIFDTLTIHVNSQSRQAIDEIRIGTTWAAVTSAWVK